MSDPPGRGHRAFVVAAGAVAVALTGVVLGRLPRARAVRADHALLPLIVDEVAAAALVVLAAVAGAAGGWRWRRWAGATAAVQAGAAALTWAGATGPADLARWIVLRTVAAAALGAALVAGDLASGSGPAGGSGLATASGPAWWGRRRGARPILGVLVLAAGLAGLPGIRGPANVGDLGRALAEGLRTSTGLAVILGASALAALAAGAADRRQAGGYALVAAALAATAVAGDVARWWSEGRDGAVALLVVRAAAAVAALGAGLALVRRPGPATGP